MVYEKKFTWKDNRSMGCSAQAAGEMIEKIEREQGEVTKEKFLDASRPEDSPTHKCFEWDDSVAAEKYRLTQSGKVINAVQVVIVHDDGEEKAPAFVKVTQTTSKERAAYNSIGIAYSDEVKKKQVLLNAKSELQAFQKKYHHLKELTGVFREIDKL